MFLYHIFKLYFVHFRVSLNQHIRNVSELTGQHLNAVHISFAELQPPGMSLSVSLLGVFPVCQVSIFSQAKSTDVPHISGRIRGGKRKESIYVSNGLFNIGHAHFPVSFLLINFRWLWI